MLKVQTVVAQFPNRVVLVVSRRVPVFHDGNHLYDAEMCVVKGTAGNYVDISGANLDLVYNFMDTYILKVSKNSEVLKDEYDKIKFLNGINFPSPKAICYFMEDNKYYLLRGCINGDSLMSDRFLNNPYLLIDVLADVFSYLKKSD